MTSFNIASVLTYLRSESRNALKIKCTVKNMSYMKKIIFYFSRFIKYFASETQIQTKFQLLAIDNFLVNNSSHVLSKFFKIYVQIVVDASIIL